MGLTSAIDWWEESQLRVLVLSSLIIQWLLFVSCTFRKLSIPGWFRSIIWLAYLGSDAVAIYGLATLFNRHKNQDRGDSSILEVVWAPILLIHLGGQDGITAYNMEDNELWTRHVLTAVSQITVAIYVFCRSWKGDDRRLLQTSILLFAVGVPKCLEKPWALKRASINSLVSSSELALKTRNREGEVEGFVLEAKAFVREQMEAEEQEAVVQDSNHPEEDQEETEASSCKRVPTSRFVRCTLISDLSKSWISVLLKPRDLIIHNRRERRNKSLWEGEVSRFLNDEEQGAPLKLFVDLSCPYPDRLAILKSFWLHEREKVHRSLQLELANVFHLLYTKEKASPVSDPKKEPPFFNFFLKLEMNRQRIWVFLLENKSDIFTLMYGGAVRILRFYLPWATIGLFHHSHIDAYNDTDVKITYALLCCTALLELYTCFAIIVGTWPATVSEYDLIGFFVRNKNHSKILSIVSLFGFKDYLEQHWWVKAFESSHRITGLVFQHVKEGWMKDIQEVTSYRMFNDNKGQRTLQLHNCWQLAWSLKRPFDESVLLWHIATDFCLYSSSFGHDRLGCTVLSVITLNRLREELDDAMNRFRHTEQHGQSIECKANICRQMSNYMMYLLFVNPEMLLPGSRRNLFTTAYKELEVILKDIQPPVEEKQLMQRIDSEMKSTSGSQEKGFIHDAWSLAQQLQDLDAEKMWDVIQGVWVEMLCFSAGRCRGYLHAKALGTGGELLTYVWLLLSNMGMETFAERLQRTEFPSGGGTAAAAPSTSEVPNGGSAPLTSEVRTGAASSTSEVLPTVADPSTSELPYGAASSTSEIRLATEDDMV